MKKSTLIVVVITAIIGTVFGYGAGLKNDDDGDGQAKRRTITVQGEGRVSGTPDVLSVMLGIEVREPEVATALRRSNEQASAVVDLLKGQGIKESDIKTADLSTYPETTPDGAKVIGYIANNTLTVRIRKIDRAGEIIDAVAQATGDSLRVNSINFSIDDPEKLMEKGRKRAMDSARVQATQFAKAAGMKLGEVRSMTNASPESPVVFDRYAAGSSANFAVGKEAFQPGAKEFSVSVKVVYDVTS